ncbi:MAG TPA: hypothetical protein VGG25_17975 [Streptosporangiaceae bacterium]
MTGDTTGQGAAGQRPVMVLVDAFSTGAMLARQAAARYRLVHLRSRPDMPGAFAASLPRDVGFEADLSYPEQAGEVLGLLDRLRPVAIVPASEFGIEVADELSGRLGLRGNDPALSAARRDKSAMMAALAAASVRAPRQHRGTSAAELVAWRRAAGLGKVVVKPLDSAGSEDVYACETDGEIAAAFAAILGKTNLMMRPNDAVLAQEYLDGDEFVVNTVSRDGTHWFTDAWLSRKAVVSGSGNGNGAAGTRRIYDHEDLLAADDPRLAPVLPYVGEVLDALGITDGPAHTELIAAPRGPCLLETGARVSGLADPPALDRCTGANQVSLAVDCYSGQPGALARAPLRYRRRERARCVNLIAAREVPMPAAALRAALAGLPAVQSIRFRRQEGEPVSVTVDLNTSPGVVFLVHPEQAEIDAAYLALRDAERALL